MAVELGSLVRHNINGFTGVAIRREEHLHGCSHIVVMATECRDLKQVIVPACDEQYWDVINVDRVAKARKPDFADPIQLGWLVRDTISGAEGVATVRHTTMFGTVDWVCQLECTNKDKTNEWFGAYEGQLKVIERREIAVSKASTAGTGNFVATSDDAASPPSPSSYRITGGDERIAA